MAGRDDLIDRFLDAIDKELAPLGRPSIDTLFVGGGTPTHLNQSQLDRFAKIFANRFELSANAEVTFEANPEDITSDKLHQLRDQGVNRISLGVQSFAPEKIRTLERSHSAEDAIAAIELSALIIGNVSIDLIFGGPDETLSGWRSDLRTAVALPIDHLSTYALTIEKGTRFFSRHQRGELSRPGEDLDVAMYESAQSVTANAGLVQYEVSSFAKSDRRCRHNLAYWRGHGWYAAGPGAARFVAGTRDVNHRSTTTYLKRIETGVSPVDDSEALTQTEYARELMAFGVRMIDGVSIERVHQQSSVDVAKMFQNEMRDLVDEGLVTRDGDVLRLTERGILLGDTVASAFLE